METVVGATAFFQLEDGSGGSELWAFCAENSTAWRAADIVPGADGSTPGMRVMVGISGVVYFDATTHSTGRELWAHDPADGSTWMVVDIAQDDPNYTTPDPDAYPGLRFSALHNGCLFFDANDGVHGRELWKMCFDHVITYGA